MTDGTIKQLARCFLILIVLRSTPVRFLRLDQVQIDVLTVPGKLMKGKRGATSDFRVPLPAEAVMLIEQAKPLAPNGYPFTDTKGGIISDGTMSGSMQDAGLDARPHGFRASLRDWLAETSNPSHEASESCIAHFVYNQNVHSYRRADFLEQREAVMVCPAPGLPEAPTSE